MTAGQVWPFHMAPLKVTFAGASARSKKKKKTAERSVPMTLPSILPTPASPQLAVAPRDSQRPLVTSPRFPRRPPGPDPGPLLLTLASGVAAAAAASRLPPPPMAPNSARRRRQARNNSAGAGRAEGADSQVRQIPDTPPGASPPPLPGILNPHLILSR